MNEKMVLTAAVEMRAESLGRPDRLLIINEEA